MKEGRQRLWMLPFSAAAFEFCRYAIKSNTHMEMNYYLFPIILCTMLFTRQDEVEMIQATRTRLQTVLFARYAVTYLFMVLYPVLRLFVTGQGNAARISVSMSTTLLFCTSVALLIRIWVRNSYAAAIISVVAHVLLIAVIEGILGTYFIPQTVRRLSPYYPDGIQNIYLYINNRLVTVGLAAAVAAVSFFTIYRREKVLSS
jgi:hypothetical protein